MRYRHATLGNRLGRLLLADVQKSLARIAASGEVGPAFLLPDDKIYHGMAKMMTSFQVGLFAGTDLTCFPQDILDIERWFRGPKSHERRIHGHKHAGIRIVREGATLIPAPGAHAPHPGVFTEQDLTQFATAAAPARQLASQQRHGVMKKTRSKKDSFS